MRRRALIAGGLGTALLSGRLRAEARPRVRVGVLTDLSGPFGAIAGQGSVACAKLAAQEFGTAAFDIDVVSADHHDDPRQGAETAARWYDTDEVDLILDVPNSEVALAVADVARERRRVFIDCGAGTAALTGSHCAPTIIHWSFDTHMLARSTGGAFTQTGGSTWFFVTAGYAFGREVEDETTRMVIAAGGRIEGTARYPFPGTTDFAPLLAQAQQSGAAVLGLANAGADAIACVRAANASGLAEQMRLACLLLQLPDVHLLGLEQAGGLLLTESFYWDLNDRTRAFTHRLMERQRPPTYPDMIQAGCYAGTLHFLKAVAAMGVAPARSDPTALVARMKAMPTEDDAFGTGTIAQDGRAMFPALLFRVKTPAESTGPWDYYSLVSSTPAESWAAGSGRDACAMRRG